MLQRVLIYSQHLVFKSLLIKVVRYFLEIREMTKRNFKSHSCFAIKINSNELTPFDWSLSHAHTVKNNRVRAFNPGGTNVNHWGHSCAWPSREQESIMWNMEKKGEREREKKKKKKKGAATIQYENAFSIIYSRANRTEPSIPSDSFMEITS